MKRKSCILVFLFVFLVLSLSSMPLQVAHADPAIFEDGFESGDLTNWDSITEYKGNITVTTDEPYSGVYSCKVNTTVHAGHSDVNAFVEHTLGGRAFVYQRTFLYVDEFYITPGYYLGGFFVCTGTGSWLWELGLTRDRYLRLTYWENGSWGHVTTSTTLLSMDTWHCIEGYGSEGTLRFWVDETEVTDLRKTGLNNTGVMDITGVFIGCLYGLMTNTTMYFDNVYAGTSYIGNKYTSAIESCNSAGTEKNSFSPGETIHVNGIGYSPSTTYPIYVVSDVTTWTNDTDIPNRVPDTATNVTSDTSGNISPTPVWSSPLTGKYDIVIDFNNNSKYDEGVDALDNDDIVTTAGFFVILEYPLGTILALVVCFAAFSISWTSKRTKQKSL